MSESVDIGSGVDMSVVIDSGTRPMDGSRTIARRMTPPVVIRRSAETSVPQAHVVEASDTAPLVTAETVTVEPPIETANPAYQQASMELNVKTQAEMTKDDAPPSIFMHTETPEGNEQTIQQIVSDLRGFDEMRVGDDRKVRHARAKYFNELFANQSDDVLKQVAIEYSVPGSEFDAKPGKESSSVMAFRDRYIKELGKKLSKDSDNPLSVIEQQVTAYKDILTQAADHMSEDKREHYLKTRVTPNIAAKRRTLIRQLAHEDLTAAETALTENPKNSYLKKTIDAERAKRAKSGTASESTAPSVTAVTESTSELPPPVSTELSQAFPYTEPVSQAMAVESSSADQAHEPVETDTSSVVEDKVEAGDQPALEAASNNPDFNAFSGMVPRPGSEAVQVGENMGAGIPPEDAIQSPVVAGGEKAEDVVGTVVEANAPAGNEEVTAEEKSDADPDAGASITSPAFPRANPADTAALQAAQLTHWNEQQDKKKDYVQSLLGDNKEEKSAPEDQALYDGPDNLTDEQRAMWKAAHGMVNPDIQTQALDQMAASSAAPVVGQRRGATEFNVPPVVQESPQDIISPSPEASAPLQPSTEQVAAWQKEAASGLSPMQVERGETDERMKKAKEAMQLASEELKKRESALDTRSVQGRLQRFSSKVGIAALAGTMLLGVVGTVSQHEASGPDTRPSTGEIDQNPNTTDTLTAPMADSSSSTGDALASSMPTSNEAGLSDPTSKPSAGKEDRKKWWHVF